MGCEAAPALTVMAGSERGTGERALTGAPGAAGLPERELLRQLLPAEPALPRGAAPDARALRGHGDVQRARQVRPPRTCRCADCSAGKAVHYRHLVRTSCTVHVGMRHVTCLADLQAGVALLYAHGKC